MVTKTKVDARQTFAWLLVTDLEMAPSSWGRPLRAGDVRAIAADFDPDRLAAIAVWHRPKLTVGRGRNVIIDGQHRVAAVRLLGWDDQRVPCLVYENLTMETAAELSLGLQERRNLHAYDKHRAALAAHDRRAIEVDKVLRFLNLTFAYTNRPEDKRRVSAIGSINLVWDRMSGTGLERVLVVCDNAWEGTAAGFSAKILKLVMTVLAAHDGQVDDPRLSATLATRSPAQWLSTGAVRRRSIAQIAQDVIIDYNKRTRGARISELTPSEYEQAAKRPPTKTVKGEIPGRTTAAPDRRRDRRRTSN